MRNSIEESRLIPKKGKAGFLLHYRIGEPTSNQSLHKKSLCSRPQAPGGGISSIHLMVKSIPDFCSIFDRISLLHESAFTNRHSEADFRKKRNGICANDQLREKDATYEVNLLTLENLPKIYFRIYAVRIKEKISTRRRETRKHSK